MTTPAPQQFPTGHRVLLLCATLTSLAVGCATAPRATRTAGPAGPARTLSLTRGDAWIGNGVCYGPHRDGQRPDGPSPTAAELRQDLALIAPRWRLLRMYSADATAAAVLELIRSEGAGLKVILGAWIDPETTPAAAAKNRGEVAAAIRLARAFPDVVVAINVGNETQASWSDHKVDEAVLIGHLRAVRAATAVPVTTADDFSFWSSERSRAIAAEVDFLLVHAYAMWNGVQLDGAVAFTREKYDEVARQHPGRLLVLGELGWATRRHSEGEQARLIKGTPGEAEQRRFRDELLAWTTAARVPNLFFEAFDENWKGGPHPDEVEKHWGLFRADRTPKQAMAAPSP